jgi:ABC-type amino acid transport substrate-binding protein
VIRAGDSHRPQPGELRAHAHRGPHDVDPLFRGGERCGRGHLHRAGSRRYTAAVIATSLRIEIVPVTRWEDALPMLRQGKGDLLVGVNDTKERRRLVAFTIQLLPAKNVVLTRRPNPPIQSLEELRGAMVAVVPNTTWADAVRQAGVPDSQTVSVEDVPAAIEALRSGKAGAAVADVLDFLLQRRRDGSLEMGLTLGRALSSAWAVRKEDSRLRESLDAYLLRLRSSANWSRLLVKYFGDDALVALGHDGVP